jgi:hypothetical protein
MRLLAFSMKGQSALGLRVGEAASAGVITIIESNGDRFVRPGQWGPMSQLGEWISIGGLLLRAFRSTAKWPSKELAFCPIPS